MAETYNDINLKSLVFNKVTNEEYRQMVQNGTIKDDEFYITPSELIDVPNIDSTTSGKYLTNDGTGALWSDVKSTNIVQDLKNPTTNTVPSTKAVSDESSRIVSIMDTKQDKSTAVNYNNISNCITEIPQDIKLELNDGTLTLKAGSKVYIPNGFESDGTTPKFDIHIISSDKVIKYDSKFNGLVIITDINDNLFMAATSYTVSGATQPTDISHRNIWYDTTTNKVKTNSPSTSNFETNKSLPIAIVNCIDVNKFTISQVFNGFGYIGNTIFALPGVKGLIPNGRNADGSLKNIGFTINSVLTTQVTSNVVVGVRGDSIGSSGKYSFDEINNQNLNSGAFWNVATIGDVIFSSDKISSFTPKTPFHALDYNDKSTISGWSMPSSRYINLTLGASGSTYIAPSDGYVYCERNSTSGSKFVSIFTVNGELGTYGLATAGVNNTKIFLPIKKGEKFKVLYSVDVDYFKFRFFYIEGGK